MGSGYQKKIESRIEKYDIGTAFSPFEFLDIAEMNTVNQILFRLSNGGTILSTTWISQQAAVKGVMGLCRRKFQFDFLMTGKCVP